VDECIRLAFDGYGHSQTAWSVTARAGGHARQTIRLKGTYELDDVKQTSTWSKARELEKGAGNNNGHSPERSNMYLRTR
jgi:hypothetical protein